MARDNAERQGVAERIEFVESDLFAAVPAEQQFDFIVSNPPYVTTAEMAALRRDVRELRAAAGAGGRRHRHRGRSSGLIPQAAERLRARRIALDGNQPDATTASRSAWSRPSRGWNWARRSRIWPACRVVAQARRQ